MKPRKKRTFSCGRANSGRFNSGGFSFCLGRYCFSFHPNIFVRTGHKWFGRWVLLIHLCRGESGGKWVRVPLFRYRGWTEVKGNRAEERFMRDWQRFLKRNKTR